MCMKSLVALLAILKTTTITCCNRREHSHGSVCRREQYRPWGFQATSSECYEAVAMRPVRSCHTHQRRTLTKDEYVSAVVRFLERKYWKNMCPPSRDDVENALGIIYKMLYRNFMGLVVFTSHVVFGTGGFLRLEAGREKWASRGILQITGEENYKKLCKIMENDFFYHHPEELRALRKKGIKGTVRFWICLIEENLGKYEEANITFWETLCLLGPSEVRNPECPESMAQIQNRMDDYDAILASLLILECRR